MPSTTLRHRLLAGLAITLLSAASASAVLAAPTEQAQVVAFNIPAGSLDAALQAFAAQSGRQISFAPELVAGLKTPGLHGSLTPDTAIAQLVAGAPLEIGRAGRNGFILKPRAVTAGADAADPFDAAGEPAATEVAEVLVTGSLIRGTRDGASPVVTFGRGDIDRNGHANLAEALSALPQNFSGGATPASQLLGSDRTFVNDTVASGVNLRGLGNSATLVLLNGRRMAGTGLKGNFADVSAIPTGAIDRVEILLDGASALYGADAVGGVVNVILRRDFEGAETRARSSIAQKGDARELQLGQTFGAAWTGGRAVISANIINATL